MARPYPLTDPMGRTHLFACGRCNHVAYGGARLGELDAPDESCVESSQVMAEKCCTCERCGIEIGRKLAEPRVCPACRPAYDAERAEQDAKWAERQAADKAALDASLRAALDVDAATRLRDEMSDLSERCWCAGWLYGTEFTLWQMLVDSDPGHWGQDEISADDLANLRRLSDRCGGWWRFDDVHGELFVALDDWTRLFDADRALTAQTRITLPEVV